jgi:hypothetical protein
MIRQVGPLIGAAVASLHREHGVDLRTGNAPARVPAYRKLLNA